MAARERRSDASFLALMGETGWLVDVSFGQLPVSAWSASRMSDEAGISDATFRYASRSAASRNAPERASVTSTCARSPDDGTVPAAVSTARVISADLAAYGTAFTSTPARSPLDGMFATALNYPARKAASLRPR